MIRHFQNFGSISVCVLGFLLAKKVLRQGRARSSSLVCCSWYYSRFRCSCASFSFIFLLLFVDISTSFITFIIPLLVVLGWDCVEFFLCFFCFLSSFWLLWSLGGYVFLRFPLFFFVSFVRGKNIFWSKWDVDELRKDQKSERKKEKKVFFIFIVLMLFISDAGDDIYLFVFKKILLIPQWFIYLVRSCYPEYVAIFISVCFIFAPACA